jgi:pantoate--beta-alanine ligase
MRAACAAAKTAAGQHSSLGLVPTMGALHEGHLSLVRAAKKQCDIVAASIFVNPTQFGPNEDFAQYPRTFAADCDLLEREGVDLLFTPSAPEMYPRSSTTTYIDVPGLSERLDGASRPGHFRGVATVVAKLFHIVSPDFAYFGQKDAAQVAVLQAMVRDLDFPVKLVICPTVRDRDGLAMSSRNRYLSPSERSRALALSQALEQARQLAEAGETDAAELTDQLRQSLSSSPDMHFEYAEVVHPDTLLPVADLNEGALIAIAARIGETRLIDNIVLLPRTVEVA